MRFIDIVKQYRITNLIKERLTKQQELAKKQLELQEMLREEEEKKRENEELLRKKEQLKQELQSNQFKNYDDIKAIYDFLAFIVEDEKALIKIDDIIEYLNMAIIELTKEMGNIREEANSKLGLLKEQTDQYESENKFITSGRIFYAHVNPELKQEYSDLVDEYNWRNALVIKYKDLVEKLEKRSIAISDEFYLSDLKDVLEYVQKRKSEIEGEIAKINEAMHQMQKNRKGKKGKKDKKSEFEIKREKLDGRILTIKNEISQIDNEIARVETEEELSKLGYSTIEQAKKAMGITTEDYMVIPIYDDFFKTDDFFYREKTLHIKVDLLSYDISYQTETVRAAINCNYHFTGNEIGALLIPLRDIDVEDIIRRNLDGTIQLNRLDIPDSVIIITNTELGDAYKDAIHVSGSVADGVQQFLEDSFIEEKDKSQIDYYEIVSKARWQETPDEVERNNAIYTSLGINYGNYDSISEKEVYVDNQRFTVSEVKFKDAQPKEIDIDTLTDILDRITVYLSNPKQENIDDIYGHLLREVLRTNPKAIPKYNKEDYTTLYIGGKRTTIKPQLPQSDEQILNRATRPGEDIAYKLMKAGIVCNKFAHFFADNKKQKAADRVNELISRLYMVKDQIIMTVINLASKNDKISLGKISDSRGTGIVMDIPYYSTITLHVNEKDKKFIREHIADYPYITRESLRNLNIESNPAIMIDGVNLKTFQTLRSINNKESRIAIITSMSTEALHKLLIRLGYTAKDFATRGKREKIIREFCSDEELDRIIKEMKDREREM